MDLTQHDFSALMRYYQEPCFRAGGGDRERAMRVRSRVFPLLRHYCRKYGVDIPYWLRRSPRAEA